MGLLASFKKSRLERKFKKNDWVIIQSIPFEQFEQTIVDYVDDGWEIEDDYQRLAPETTTWQCELRKGISTLTCVWSASVSGQIYGPERVLTSLASKLNLSISTSISHPWF
ncbi:MAG: hypothetical protein AXW14_11640 [Alteromonas sp. Nap_26]|nr:MAG: hypothetical protein AXW14_11640 [Alteromonas sp. Nap_26]